MQDILSGYDCFLIDMDGVIFLHDEPLPGHREFIDLIRNEEKRFLFITNNSFETRASYVEKLGRMGIEVKDTDILTSAQGVRRYLEQNCPIGSGGAFVIGGEGLRSEVEKLGMHLLEGDDAKRAEYVIVGWDPTIDFEKLKIATVAVRNGATYIVTDLDGTYPAKDEQWPGTGALAASITEAAGKEPLSIGKPKAFMLELGMEMLQASPERTLMIGDRLDSDIQAGRDAGVDTLLVLSGVADAEDSDASDITATYTVEGLRELL